MTGIIKAAANIVDGANPPFTVEDFRALMPAFTPDIAPDDIVQIYVDMASAVVKRARWDEMWLEGMRLFIAHFLTLYAETVPEKGSGLPGIVNAGAVKGNRTQKTVKDISVSYDMNSIMDDLQGYGAWKLTSYGVQYITFVKAFARGGMYVR